MAVSPLLALTCRCDLGSVSAWDTQDVLVMGKGCETIGVPSISDRILQAGAKAEGMPSGHEGLLASLTKEVGGVFSDPVLPTMASRACKAICTKDICTLGQSRVTELSLCFLHIPVWRDLDGPWGHRQSVHEIGTSGEENPVAGMWELSQVPSLSVPIASETWKEIQYQRGPLTQYNSVSPHTHHCVHTSRFVSLCPL